MFVLVLVHCNGLRLPIFVSFTSSFTFSFFFEVALKYVQIYRISEEQRGFTGADKRDAGTMAFDCPFSSHVSAWGILGVHFTSTFINIYKLEQQPEVPSIQLLRSKELLQRIILRTSLHNSLELPSLGHHVSELGGPSFTNRRINMKKKKQINDNTH